MSKSIHIEIKTEVKEEMDKIYSAENRAKLEKKEMHRHRVTLRAAREKQVSMRNKRLSVRKERQSVKEDALRLEKKRQERMSLDEKAAQKRQERKTLKERTAGRSEFIAIEEEGKESDDDDERVDDERQKKFRQSYQANSFAHLAGVGSNESIPEEAGGGGRGSSVGKKPPRKKFVNEKISPLTALLLSGRPPREYKPVNDITILSSDDLLTNEKLRYKEVVRINFDNEPRKKKEAEKLLKKSKGGVQGDDIEGGRAETGLEEGEKKEETTPLKRSTMALKLKQSVKLMGRLSLMSKQQNVDGAQTALTMIEQQRPRKTIAMKALDSALNKKGVASDAASRITGSLIGFSHKAALRAAEMASPSAKQGKERISFFAQSAMDKFSKKDAKLSPEERERVVAARKLQKFWRRYYWCEPILVDGVFMHGYRQQRAARMVTYAMKSYKSMINQEKWLMIMKMERRDRKDREDKARRRITKDANKNIADLKKQRHLAEHAAKKTGWGIAGKDKTLRGKAKWSKRELAILVAINLKFGYPSHEDDWQQFYHFFADKDRRAIRTKVVSMKDDETLFDMDLMLPQNINPKELISLNLMPEKKDKKKRKALTLDDIV